MREEADSLGSLRPSEWHVEELLRNTLRFSLAAPIPPLTFLRGEARIARLSHSGMKSVEDAGILVCAGEAFESGIEFTGIVFSQLRDRMNAEKMEIAFDGRTNGNEVTELTLGIHGGYPFCSL